MKSTVDYHICNLAIQRYEEVFSFENYLINSVFMLISQVFADNFPLDNLPVLLCLQLGALFLILFPFFLIILVLFIVA